MEFYYRIVDHTDTGAGVAWIPVKKGLTYTSTTYRFLIDLPVSTGWKNIQIETRRMGSDGDASPPTGIKESYKPTSSQIRFAAGAIFGLGGQSNIVRLQTLTGGTVPDAGTSQFTGGSWATNAGEGCVNLANQLRANLGMAVAVVNLGAGQDATALTAEGDWLAAGHWVNNDDSEGTIYALWKAHLNLALTAEKNIEGVVWFQGEAESTAAVAAIFVPQRRYADRLDVLVNQFIRSDFSHMARTGTGGVGKVPFHIIGLTSHNGILSGFPHALFMKCAYASMTDALRDWSERDEASTYTQGYDSSMQASPTVDQIHIDAAGGTLLGLRVAGAITRYINPAHSSSGMGPYISGYFWTSSTTLVLEVTHDKGSDLTVPANAHLCFQMLDEGGLIHISAAAKSTASRIQLTLASAPTGANVVLKYATAGRIDPAWAIKDDATPAMPLQQTYYTSDEVGDDTTVLTKPGVNNIREIWTDTDDIGTPSEPITAGTTTQVAMATGGDFDKVAPGARVTIMRGNDFIVNGVVTAVELSTGGNDWLTFEPVSSPAPAAGDYLRVQAGVVLAGNYGRQSNGGMTLSVYGRPNEATNNG